MEKFIIRLLSIMGFGLNGVIPTPERFKAQLAAQLYKGESSKVIIDKVSENEISYILDNTIRLNYKLRGIRIIEFNCKSIK